MSADTTKRFHN
jgi:hypothetical protein